MKHFVLTIIISCLTLQVFSQAISTDRPDLTESYFTVPRNGLQIETGYTFEEISNNQIKTHTYNSTLLRYGVTDNFELRYNIAYLHEMGTGSNTIDNKGIGDMEIGFKMSAFEQDRFIPALSFLFHVVLPVGDSNFSPSKSEPLFKLIGGWEFAKGNSLSYNLGVLWPDGTDEVDYDVSIAYSHPIIKDKLSLYVEYFETYNGDTDTIERNCDGGFTYLVKDNFQLDLSAGVNLKGFGRGYFISAGFSYLLDLKKR
ncbi:transporter [Halosquirtibacter laminarini]|uniref:Transporter n=1 Tax=Halosquirtibacter laminarini TaxID=3374600 RepID=A0AC61NG39_9BACT|nr:transporter [Prolixibacteraceae bacterium]